MGGFVRAAIFAGEVDIQRPLVWDGALSKAMEALTSGVVLAGLALHLGASPVLIGMLAASPFLAQLSQFGGLRIVFATHERRRVSIVSALASRILVGSIGFIALVGPSPWSLPALLILLTLAGSLSAISSLSWTFWMRDLIPQHSYGAWFAKRFSAQAAVSVIVTLAGGVVLGVAAAGGRAGVGFAALYFAGAGIGIAGLWFTTRLPEVPLNPADSAPSLGELVRGIFRHAEHRSTVVFVLAWTFATFLSLPFITVFLLQDAGVSFAGVAILMAVAMVASLSTFRFWGRSSDRFGPRAVLGLVIPLAALSIALLPLGAGNAPWRLAFLGAVFVLNGVTFAAVDVSIAKLVAREAPFTGAGTFLAGAGILRALAAGVATLVGGAIAGRVAGQSLRLEVAWAESVGVASIAGYAFLFLASGLLMLYAWHRVLALRGAGEGEPLAVLHEAQVELAGLAPFRGVRIVSQLAGHVASHLIERRRGAKPRPRGPIVRE